MEMKLLLPLLTTTTTVAAAFVAADTTAVVTVSAPARTITSDLLTRHLGSAKEGVLIQSVTRR